MPYPKGSAHSATAASIRGTLPQTAHTREDQVTRERLRNRCLAFVVLDHAAGAHLRLVWVLAELASGPSLAQQIPALVQPRLQVVQARLFFGAQPVLLLCGPQERVLFVHHAVDVLQDLVVSHRHRPSFSSPSSPIHEAPPAHYANIVSKQ